MKTALLCLLLAPLPLLAAEPEPSQGSLAKVVDLRIEAETNPTTVNTPLPRFSWRIETDERGWLQKSYRILVASSPELLAQDKGDLWDSGDVQIRQSLWIEFGGAPLESGTVIHWKVQVTDRNAKTSAWSTPATATIKFGASSLPQLPLFPKDAPSPTQFECSDPKLNSLFTAAGKRLPEITSLRDLGLSLRGASFHTSLLPGARQWLDQLNNSTNPLGYYPTKLPTDGSFGSTQSDSAIMAAHALWWTTGDSTCYDRHIGTMKRYIFARKQFARSYPKISFGKLPADTLPKGDPTPTRFIDDASQALNVRLLLDLGGLASNDPYELYTLRQYSNSLPEAFAEAHLFPNHTLQYESITAQLLALRAGVLTTEEQKKAVTEQLIKQLKVQQGNPVLQQSPLVAQNLLHVLTWTGHHDLALEILQAQPVDKLSPVALVACSDWILSMLTGISSMEPAFTFIGLHPRIPNKDVLSEAKASFHSPVGPIRSHWRHDGKGLVYKVTIPPNTIALIELPTKAGQSITEGGKPLEDSKLFFAIKKGPASTSFQTGSGSYTFRIDH